MSIQNTALSSRGCFPTSSPVIPSKELEVAPVKQDGFGFGKIGDAIIDGLIDAFVDAIGQQLETAIDQAINDICAYVEGAGQTDGFDFGPAVPMGTGGGATTSNAPVGVTAGAGLTGGVGGAGRNDLSGFRSNQYDGIIREMAAKYGVPARLIKSVIEQESKFNPTAGSRVGARGLMQLMPGTAREMGVRNSLDPRQNIEGGTKYLARMLKMFKGNVRLALAAYNAGPGNVLKYKGIPPFRETQGYVRNITANYYKTA